MGLVSAQDYTNVQEMRKRAVNPSLRICPHLWVWVGPDSSVTLQGLNIPTEQFSWKNHLLNPFSLLVQQACDVHHLEHYLNLFDRQYPDVLVMCWDLTEIPTNLLAHATVVNFAVYEGEK